MIFTPLDLEAITISRDIDQSNTLCWLDAIFSYHAVKLFCGCSWLPVAAICIGVGVEVGVGVGVEVDCGSKMQCTLSWLPVATNCIAKHKPGDRWKI